MSKPNPYSCTIFLRLVGGAPLTDESQSVFGFEGWSKKLVLGKPIVLKAIASYKEADGRLEAVVTTAEGTTVIPLGGTDQAAFKPGDEIKVEGDLLFSFPAAPKS